MLLATVSFYIAALSVCSGMMRERVNTEALHTLQKATFVGTNSYQGTTYKIYETLRPAFARPGPGNVALWPVSAHILASANHYERGIRWLWPLTFKDGTNSVVIKKLEWVRLYDWALTNGWKRTELDRMNLGDIALIRCAKATAVPSSQLPFFMSPAQRKAWFGGTMEGVAAWAQCQQYPQARPVVMSGNTTWRDSDAGAAYDAALAKMGTQYVIHVGDSGKPIFMMLDGKPVVLSTFHCEYSGPDYVAAFPVLKAFVESYGDTLKVVSE